MDSDADAMKIYAKAHLEDQVSRIRFQHDYVLAGMRSFIFVNGAAIIALLTFAGNVPASKGPAMLGAALLWYVAGLVSATLSLVFAYLSEGHFLSSSGREGVWALGLSPDDDAIKKEVEHFNRFGDYCIWTALALTVVSLSSFVAGSMMAMGSIT